MSREARGGTTRMTFTPRTMQELSMEWPSDLDHISASSLKMAVRCPEQWRQVYVLGKRLPPAAAMIAGRADHAAVEESMKKKVASHVDLPVSDVQAHFLDKFESEVRDTGIDEVEVREKGERMTDKLAKVKALDDLKTEGIRTVGFYHQTVSPFVQPIAVERKFELQPKQLPVKVVGRIDLETEDRIVDRKRAGRARTRPEPEWVIQAEIYQLAEPKPHAWHISVTTKQPKVVWETPDLVVQPKSAETMELLLDQIVGEVGYYYRRYGPDTPWPARGKLHPWACGYCGFRETCWAWKES